MIALGQILDDDYVVKADLYGTAWDIPVYARTTTGLHEIGKLSTAQIMAPDGACDVYVIEVSEGKPATEVGT